MVHSGKHIVIFPSFSHECIVLPSYVCNMHQDTKSARLITVCKRTFKWRSFGKFSLSFVTCSVVTWLSQTSTQQNAEYNAAYGIFNFNVYWRYNDVMMTSYIISIHTKIRNTIASNFTRTSLVFIRRYKTTDTPNIINILISTFRLSWSHHQKMICDLIYVYKYI